MTNEALIELLPCPFCGSQPEARGAYDESVAWVECTGHDCFAQQLRDTLDEAKAAWNTRAAIEALQPPEPIQDGRLREALDNAQAVLRVVPVSAIVGCTINGTRLKSWEEANAKLLAVLAPLPAAPDICGGGS